MSLVNVLPFFRTRMDGLGYSEWEDAFSIENIPATIFNKSYHLEVSPVIGEPIPHRSQQIEMPIILRAFYKGYRSINDARDDAISESETILGDILTSSVRLSVNVKNILFDSYQLLPLNESNDNSIILEINFRAIVILEI